MPASKIISTDLTIEAVKNILQFKKEIDEVFDKFDMSLEENICRRNQVMSAAQEKFFTQAFKKKYPGTTCDGRTGQADIVIPKLNKEVECKLTSARDSGGFSLQTDEETIVNKGSLDYLYMLTNKEFTSFCVLYFYGLTRDDFLSSSNGNRGKIQMNKTVAMKKCVPLLGSYTNQTELWRMSTLEEISKRSSAWTTRFEDITSRLQGMNDGTIAKENLKETLKREVEAYSSKISDLTIKASNYLTGRAVYKFNLQEISID